LVSGPLIGRLILLLTTTGRKSGLPRVTPLQYEEFDGLIYIGSARGTQADWYRNLVADPHVRVQVKGRRFEATAETSTDRVRLADFIELRLKRHPRLVGAMLHAEGLPARPTREQIERYAANLALVVIHPAQSEGRMRNDDAN
jgi:deazaflavin-dependent oxidoreductase (nitroreductase family)